jgi:hypothetical protein
MRRRYSSAPEPRADGFVYGGLFVVLLLTVGAFAGSAAFVPTEQPGARAYTLSALPSAGTDEVTTSAVAVDEMQTSAVPASAPAGEAAMCNIAKCAAAYRSFDVNDCTFQPFDGERRICPY